MSTAKKTWTSKIAILAIALTLVTSYFVGNTFAKYITSASGSDTARVAHWGVAIDGNTASEIASLAVSDLFANSYENAGGTLTTVDGGTDKVFAPGTAGAIGFTVSGAPEVAYTFVVTATGGETGNWKDAEGDDYLPIVYTLTDNNTSDSENYGSMTALVAALNDLTTADTIAAGTAIDLDYTISWAWAFESGNDAADTYLGDYAADPANAATIPGVELSITITVTQVNE
ncbi:MAG: hypothetical protein WDA00_03670 [Eubacteriales bacterium]